MKNDTCCSYQITYSKDGVGPLSQKIYAASERNALVRLGQIYGDRLNCKNPDIEVLSVEKNIT